LGLSRSSSRGFPNAKHAFAGLHRLFFKKNFHQTSSPVELEVQCSLLLKWINIKILKNKNTQVRWRVIGVAIA